MYLLSLFFSLAIAEPYIAVLQSDSFVEYQKPTSAFLKKCSLKTKAYDIHGNKELAQARIMDLKKNKPQVIFAVGAKAAWIAQQHLPDIPLVYAMVQNPERFGLRQSNSIEIVMFPPKDLSIAQMQLFFPETAHVAFFTGSQPSPEILEYTKLMESYDIKTTIYQSESTNSLRQTLAKLPKDIDIIWLAKDPEWLTPERFYHINNASIKKSIPIITNSTPLTHAGALLSISSNYESIGKVGADVVTQLFQQKRQLLLGTEQAPLEEQYYTDDLFITLNRKTQKSIELELEEYMIDFINEEVLD